MSMICLAGTTMAQHSFAASRALELLAQAPTVFRMSEALALGVNRYTLYSLLENGLVDRIARGLYQLTSLPPVAYPDGYPAACCA